MKNTAHESKVMDGRVLAKRIRDATRAKVETIIKASGVTPTLATVLVGNDPASATYVRMKAKRCEDVGIHSIRRDYPADIPTCELVQEIKNLGDDPAIHGILVQHPVPKPIDKRDVFEAIPLEKDVDGVTSAALGKLILGMPVFGACTPRGIIRLLLEYDVNLRGADAVVLGRSPILGRPMASMLINAHATVTLCHSHTKSLPSLVRRADVLIAAVGIPRFVEGDWIKPGSVVIDAGYNKGNIGDVDFDAALEVASLITPVPGGVGPMTIATLVDQTADAAAQQLDVKI